MGWRVACKGLMERGLGWVGRGRSVAADLGRGRVRGARAPVSARGRRARCAGAEWREGGYGQPAANFCWKQMKSLTLRTGAVVLPSQLA